MGKKYRIDAFNYPYKGYSINKQTNFLIVCIIWFAIFSMQYDGVDVVKRGE